MLNVECIVVSRRREGIYYSLGLWLQNLTGVLKVGLEF